MVPFVLFMSLDGGCIMRKKMTAISLIAIHKMKRKGKKRTTG